MRTLTTDELKEKLDRKEDFAFLNVLDRAHYEQKHIPGSASIPVHESDFESKVEEFAGGKDRPVVVYCASTDCDASPTAAKRLDESGFSQVYDYEGGTKAWEEAGLPVERGQ